MSVSQTNTHRQNLKKLSNKIGVMQGRLLPKYKGRYQAHPVGYWEKEFPIAGDLGLESIEFILDFEDAKKNPLLCKNGLKIINGLSLKTGVTVNSVCADFFMEMPLHSSNIELAKRSAGVLEKLISHCSVLNISDIVIPCVDKSALRSDDDIKRLTEQLSRFLPLIKKLDVNLSLETDLAPEPFANFLEQFPSKKICVNYDTGNSASLGYNLIEELDAYGNRISDIHLKDRVLGGASVPLGEGDANFELFFEKLLTLDYCGPFILQAYRDKEGYGIFKSQLAWITPFLDNFIASNIKPKQAGQNKHKIY